MSAVELLISLAPTRARPSLWVRVKAILSGVNEDVLYTIIALAIILAVMGLWASQNREAAE